MKDSTNKALECRDETVTCNAYTCTLMTMTVAMAMAMNKVSYKVIPKIISLRQSVSQSVAQTAITFTEHGMG